MYTISKLSKFHKQLVWRKNKIIPQNFKNNYQTSSDFSFVFSLLRHTNGLSNVMWICDKKQNSHWLCFLGVTSVSYNILTVGSPVSNGLYKVILENKDKGQCGGKNERRLREKKRGVYVPHPANKQKSKHQWRKYCDTWCCRSLLHLPTQVSQKAILLAKGQKQRKKPTPLSSWGVQGQ